MNVNLQQNARGDFTEEDLKTHLKDIRLSSEWLFQIHVIQRRSYLFSREENGISKEMNFRREIGESIGLSINEVGIVGSAQIGYSIKPYAKLRAMDALYQETMKNNDRSDIDVAIVSKDYFSSVHQALFSFTKGFSTPWEYNDYYPTDNKLEHFDIKRVDYQFFTYFARGWIRPDLVPSSFEFGFKNPLNKWKKALNRKVSVGIYRDWNCLKDYQKNAFEALRRLAIKGGL